MSESAKRWISAALALIPLPVLVWALWPYPSVLRKPSGETFLLSVSIADLLKLAAVFYGLYLLPGIVLLNIKAQEKSPWRWITSRNLLLAFLIGCTAHVLAAFIQKYLSLSYSPLAVGGSFLSAYLLLLATLKWIPIPPRIIPSPLAGGPHRTPPVRERWGGAPGGAGEGSSAERVWSWLILILTLTLGLEMALRGRGSSLNLSGDGFPHLINFLGTLKDGPLPDGLPFYSTFILNIHPMAFHALLANLKTLTPGILHIDFFRYFSVLMVPVFVACMTGFLRELTQSWLAAALGALAALLVSGGGLSLRIPIVFFPWYWSVSWCLAAGVFYLLLKSRVESKTLCFWGGVAMGVGVLFHPFFAFRMGSVMALFLPLELLRRVLRRESIRTVLSCAAVFGLGVLLIVGAWIVPLVLRFGWEPTYPYDYILKTYSSLAPDAVNYIRRFKEATFGLKDIFWWSWWNAGLFAVLLAPVGTVLLIKKFKDWPSSLLLAWPAAMAAVIFLGVLPNTYRYFEYFFFALVALASYGAAFLLRRWASPWQSLVLMVLVGVSLVGVRLEYYPKYRRALDIYGRLTLTPQDIAAAEGRAHAYFRSKQAGRLDQDYGSYTGYLWSRQQKVWDIYIQNKMRRKR